MAEDNAAAADKTESTRRRFMLWGLGILTSLCGVIVGIPLIGSFVGPAFRTTKPRWIKVADVGYLARGPARQPEGCR